MPHQGTAGSTYATTRAVSGFSAARLPPLLEPAQVVASPETGLQYEVKRLLGQGGFGQVYLTARRGRSAVVPAMVCIKVSARIDGWQREAYFGQLLDGHARAIRVYDRFPIMRPGAPILYCLALEYAPHGDLDSYVQRTPKRWP